jgi:hypothetical protein
MTTAPTERNKNQGRLINAIVKGHSKGDLLKTATYLWRESRDTASPLTMGDAIEITVKMAEIMESGEWE